MKTIPLADETAPAATHSSVRSVVSRSRPQSSALTMSRPVCRTPEIRSAPRVSGEVTVVVNRMHAIRGQLARRQAPCGACLPNNLMLFVKNRFNRVICSRRVNASSSGDTGLSARRTSAHV